MSEREPSIKPKITKVEEGKVERKVELDAEREKEIETYLNYQEKKVKHLLRETKTRKLPNECLIPDDDYLRVKNLFWNPLDKASKQLKEKTPGAELIHLLELPGREEEELERISDVYSKWERLGLIPSEDAKKEQALLGTKKTSHNKERKELLRILTERKKEG